jgi:hypothetical protein
MLGTQTVRQPNESAAAELRAEYCSNVLEIRLVSAQKPSLPFINLNNYAFFVYRPCENYDNQEKRPLQKVQHEKK